MRANRCFVKLVCTILSPVVVFVILASACCAADDRPGELEKRLQVFVGNVVMLPESGAAVVFLVTMENDRYLPITIGQFEASAILRSLGSIETPRPMTHDLLLDIARRLDGKIIGVTVTSLDRSGTFKAMIEVERKDGLIIGIDARPSDSIALAVKTGAGLFVATSVMEQAGKEIQEDSDRDPKRSEPPEPPPSRKIVPETIL
jgi:uncharacterized protein